MAAESIHYDNTPVVPGGDQASIYEQSINDLDGLPQTNLTPAQQLEGSMPNIFRVPRVGVPNLWLRRYETVAPLYVKATKADVGGVGGHVEVSAVVKATVLEHVLHYNSIIIGGRRMQIFESVFAHHTGDDVGITGVISEQVMEHEGAVDELLWDALNKGGDVAGLQGLYGPRQDLKADAFTGNIRGLGPATVVLPLPFRPPYNEINASQTVLLATADKTEPGAYNHITTGAYLDPNFCTGLLTAESKMRNGFIFEVVDVDTKAQALEQGATPATLNQMMTELGRTERAIELRGPEDYYNLGTLMMNSARFVIARIYSRNDDNTRGALGLVVSAERLHNIPTPDGRYIYGGKDDPVMLALCQGDWPAAGEISSPIARTPLVAGDCRGSHFLNVYPVPLNEQTSYWSGPIMSLVTMSINLETGHIGAISDQFAKGTPWDEFRAKAAREMLNFRNAQGYKHPGTLQTSEQEYVPGYVRRMAQMEGRFQRRSPTV